MECQKKKDRTGGTELVDAVLLKSRKTKADASNFYLSFYFPLFLWTADKMWGGTLSKQRRNFTVWVIAQLFDFLEKHLSISKAGQNYRALCIQSWIKVNTFQRQISFSGKNVHGKNWNVSFLRFLNRDKFLGYCKNV